ncbi:conserved hypothetical protein [Rubrivivax sp. A210]|uniref:thioredoxin family protein n=1 Tax=Rubrivivax sp. A210 TaxID=2772301 RepID=UPI00191895C3|nr:thioredoxin family protein [Rubrivivax sp. A210]CAD5371994.1 conserved hypothetical protein [Rubrivivax sp. A210]
MDKPALAIACLCAGWCRLCNGYTEVLAAVVDEMATQGAALRLRWIDIEDESELVGDYDVETFPTLVVVDAGRRLRFAGPVTPQPEAVQRLLRSLLDDAGGGVAPGATPEALAFAARLCRELGR